MTHMARRSIFSPSIFSRSRIALAATLGVGMLLAACTQGPDSKTTAPSSPEVRSRASLQLQQYYANMQTRLQSQGLMRTDRGGPDAPFTAAILVKNFERVALYDEYAVQGGRFVARKIPSRLRRWTTPIRIGIVFGDLVPEKQRATDRTNVATYAAKLARLTRTDISISDKNPNVSVLFMYRNEMRRAGPLLHRRVPNLSNDIVDEIINIPRNTLCVTYAFSNAAGGSAYTAAIVLIKAEHTDLMRLSCIHEEMGHAMGLANDSPNVRPSIFNDDEEFALLTRQDELMLKMLYDPRLRLGMTAQAARPLLPIIARDVMRGGS